MKTFTGLAVWLALAAGLNAAETRIADFTGAHGWGGPHHMKDIRPSGHGLSFTVTDEDPWLVSPPTPLPAAPTGARDVASGASVPGFIDDQTGDHVHAAESTVPVRAKTAEDIRRLL